MAQSFRANGPLKLGHLSGIATETARWMDAIEPAVRAMLALPSDDR